MIGEPQSHSLTGSLVMQNSVKHANFCNKNCPYLPCWKRSTIFSVIVRCNTGDESTVEVEVVP